MKVLVLALRDWAGVGNLLTQSLRSVGIDARFYVENRTLYKHPGVSMSMNEAINFAKECDIIQYMHSEKVLINADLSNKKIVVFHGGGKFRWGSKKVCKIFNNIVDCSLIQTYDLLGLGAKNEKWILPPIDTESIKPVYYTGDKKIIVGHYPSSRKTKGSDDIQKIIKKIRNKVPDFEYRYSYKRVPWKKQINRMSSVDIYIERMSLKGRGKKNKGKLTRTGVWGMTALEASALGKIVVTNFIGQEQYEKEFGKCYLQVANSEKDMEKLLVKLLSKSKDELLDLKYKTRKWVEDCHSLESIGSCLRGIYETL